MLRYYIADLHLDAKRPDIIRAFGMFLHEKACHANELYLLGDIFEAWIGDDATPEYLAPLLSQLQELSLSGVKIFFQHGNRDFLVGEGFAHRTGSHLISELHCTNSPHGKTLILHGDQLCTEDEDYQAFRNLVRNPQWQQQFLAKPINERLEIAQKLRAASKEQGAMKSADITDVTPAAVSQQLTAHGANLMIHGHTHRPGIHSQQSPSGGMRIVLGDWDSHGWYLEQDEQGSRLYAFELPCKEGITAELRDSLGVPG